MTLALNLFLLLASVVVLARSSLFLVRSLIAIAGYFRLTEFSVAFILMALATSLPEIFVGISAAIEGVPTLVLGNVLGSNIADLTIVFGIVLLVGGGVYSKSVIARRDAFYMFMFTLAPIFLLIDGIISRGDAVVLIILYVLYLLRLLDQRKSFHETEKDGVNKKELFNSIVLFLIGSLLLIFSAQILVFASKNIAGDLGLSLGIVGLFIVAIGTSLPELAFELRAVRNDEDGLVLGDIIGSVVTNSTLVLAITSLIRPIQITHVSLYTTTIFFLGFVLILFELIVRRDKRLGVLEGLVFIFTYIIFVISEFGIGIATHSF